MATAACREKHGKFCFSFISAIDHEFSEEFSDSVSLNPDDNNPVSSTRMSYFNEGYRTRYNQLSLGSFHTQRHQKNEWQFFEPGF